MIASLLFSDTAFAFAERKLEDAFSPKFVPVIIFFIVILLGMAIAALPKGQARTKRSLALLVVLTATLGMFTQLLPLNISTGLSLAVFLGSFGVIYFMGRFDSPE